jgi:hypothetical protein
MFKRSAGWNTEKAGSVSWTKPVAKRGGNPCLSNLYKSGSNEQDAEVGWPTTSRDDAPNPGSRSSRACSKRP